MDQRLQKGLRWGANLVLAAAVLAAMAVWLPGAFHMKAYVVTSSSMEPTIRPGSVIYVAPYRDLEEIRVGDIVSFETGGVLVTHRIVALDQEKNQAVTKGDGNRAADAAPLPLERILGKVRFQIPGIGYLLLRES